MDDGGLQFKFRLLDAGNRPTGFLATRGSFDGETLLLGKVPIPAVAIARVRESFGKLLVIVVQKNGSFAPVAFQVYGGKTQKLLGAINTISSVYQTQAHLAALQQAGKGALFRAIQCPFCKCIVDLTGFPETPQFHCAFCDTIVARDSPAPDAPRYRRCDHCRRFSQPQNFTAFYFYFLLVVHGYRYQQMCMCRACMRGEAWKLFFGNLLFVLGVPNAIAQIYRAYSGNLGSSPAYKDLDAANALAVGKQTSRAVAIYEKMEARPGASAGIWYNHALALEDSFERPSPVPVLEACLAQCANYYPAAECLLGHYTARGHAQDAARLKALVPWSRRRIRLRCPNRGA